MNYIKLWQFVVSPHNCQIEICQHFLLTYMYVCMAILYQTSKFKSANISGYITV